MKVYVGQTRSGNLINELRGLGWGEMAARGELPPRRRPWAFDNGAFGDWKAQRPFKAAAFQRDIDTVSRLAEMGDRPDFIVCPDIVAGGDRSLEFSLSWAPELVDIAPLLLPVQDGMSTNLVEQALVGFAGLFVGGTLDFKLSTGAAWAGLAHSSGLICHVGRVGTDKRVRWARAIGADSIDSCLPLWSTPNTNRFKAGLECLQVGFAADTWGRRVAEDMGARP